MWLGAGKAAAHTFDDFLVGELPAATGRRMHFTVTTVLRLKDGKSSKKWGWMTA
jgi:hypothetical protein